MTLNIYIYSIVAIVVLALVTTYYIRGVQIDNYKIEVQQLETSKVIMKDVAKVKEFESNQTIELYKQKAVQDEVNTSIGTHTISF